ncbi:PRTRC system protein F [Trinickia dinghuensis]|uniref:PRTRC system protein F n=1 Tax=Trinickia dinghuensis TaxID=2291023 RepID=A0A3D8K296_9BURK|nr:PRTRC system protein F [Trinickia dinghuensis]RDU99182.1 PRTRC system protein F [Trinickia dinghuensis]
MSFNPITLPSLAEIPARYVIQSRESFTRPLAKALLDNGLIEAGDIVRVPTSEGALCADVLSRYWAEITRDLSMFDWQLRIGQNQYSRSWNGDLSTEDGKAFVFIHTTGGPVSCGTISIGGAMKYLEGLQRGFGQTILSALYDVLGMLPLVCTTRDTIGIGQHVYWQGYGNEKDAIEELTACYDCTEKELLDQHEFVSRKEMFGPMPQWAAHPKRRLPRRMIDRVSGYDHFANTVVQAMDELWTVLTFCGPFPELSSPDLYADLLDFTLIVRWDEHDSTGRIIDDYMHFACEGDYIEAASVSTLDLSDLSISKWLQGILATAKLARAAERVLDLLGSNEYEEQRSLVRVFA